MPLPYTSQKRRPPPSEDGLAGLIASAMVQQGLSLPPDMGCGSGSTCWRRFQQWTALGLWQKVHGHLLALLGQRGLLNLEHAIMDSASCRAQAGGEHTGPNLTGPRPAAKGICSPMVMASPCGPGRPRQPPR